jgi:hypothetical protein
MELLQNADDAGASEVAFLLDNQQYGTSSVLGALPNNCPSSELSAFAFCL